MNISAWFKSDKQDQDRIQSALHSLTLDNSSTCFMIADVSRTIVYANKAVIAMLALAENDIRKDLPNFSVARVVGSNIDIFHKNPAHQKSMLERLSSSHTAEIRVGGRIFKLVLNPLFDSMNRPQGTSVEWHDMTDIVKQNILTTQVVTALGATSSNVMVADADRNIVYMNKSVVAMLREAESDLRKALPQFSVDKVIGSNMDIFHSKPSHQSHLLANLKDTYVGNIVVAGRSFRLIANPIITEKGERIGSVVEWQDRTKEVAAEHELSRILGALETTTTNVMIADNDRNILYMNKSVANMLRQVEADLKQELPHFSVDKIIGSNMDIFHKNPAHQMHILATLNKTYVANIKVGRLHFRLVANPIFSKTGERIGSVVEWLDRTVEVAVENEISVVVEAAALGDFSARIETDSKKDFFLKLAQGLNSLLNTTEGGLNDINSVLQAISKGDLTERVTADYQGSFEALKDGCNQTAENLSQMLGEIREAVDTINTASSEISQGNTDLSSRTEQQASSLEETASSMEELTSTVRQNADNARQANTLAAKASDVAIEGGSLIEQVVKTMASINESAQKIADIIGVIDGIAFQTNILALNAAVEAARAGEQGRGFAVVASEVRTLAQRSANAAKDIKALISDSVSKINNGNELVGKSGNTMREIVTSIKRVNDIMAEIAAASSEQSAGLDEVGKAVTQMDEMTQQNAALVEQAAAAAESLLSQSEQLASNVARFKLDDEPIRPVQRVMSTPKKQTKSTVVKPAAKSLPKSTGKLLKPSKSDDDEWESF
jgi:methyl-accepting chemotaxis protein